ncbi:hypothetical protein MP228_009694 [Amoeboaphelidium protococcarum]|nr:hypothetical protein MP228_009694 [Amoeboaphelidium protococcarum]
MSRFSQFGIAVALGLASSFYIWYPCQEYMENLAKRMKEERDSKKKALE